MNNILELKWGTMDPIPYKDSKYGQIELRVTGICIYTIINAAVSLEQMQDTLLIAIRTCVYELVNENQDQNYIMIGEIVSNNLVKKLIPKVADLGIVVNEIKFVNVDLDDVSQKKIAEMQLNEIKEDRGGVIVVQTDEGAKNGQNKCPKCGATEISLSIATGKLKCEFCRCEFEPEKVSGLEEDVNQLSGEIIGSGATDIVADTNSVLTFKCSSCGAEVVIDTSESTNARCHWCRSQLSVNQQVPNGSVPDVVLPFGIKKEEAQQEIKKFVGKRKFFAHPKFTQEFTTENIMGVYFPYMVVDVNAHSNLSGQGEHEVKHYTEKKGDRYETYYDVDLYNVERDFDIIIEGLTVESSSDKLNTISNTKTTNVINAIMPFDIENAVKWDANYLKGFSSEKRDTNIEQLKPLVEKQAKDIAKFAANETLGTYDRGVAWHSENMEIKGQQWKAAYLPVWLYSYQEVKGGKNVLHYVAVNARTKETMGSVPVHMPKLIGVSALVEFLGILLMLFIDWEFKWAFLLIGFIYFILMYGRYRNQTARHTYELETKKQISNVQRVDNLVKRMERLTNSRMNGANNTSISSNHFINKMINPVQQQNNNSNVDNSN